MLKDTFKKLGIMLVEKYTKPSPKTIYQHEDLLVHPALLNILESLHPRYNPPNWYLFDSSTLVEVQQEIEAKNSSNYETVITAKYVAIHKTN